MEVIEQLNPLIHPRKIHAINDHTEPNPMYVARSITLLYYTWIKSYSLLNHDVVC